MSLPHALRSSVDSLRQCLSGRLHLRGEAGYDHARRPGNLLVDQRPWAVVEPATSIDVVRAIGFARQHGLGVSTMCAGYGIAPGGHGQVLIATGRLDAVTVDPRHRTALVGPGARWAGVTAAAASHGLVPVASTAPHVGAVGSTLGGGIGWLARRHGLAIDKVRSFEIVTPDGQQRVASPAASPALFWALCGAGGGTFGVVTAMEIDLVPRRDVVAGTMWFDGGLVDEVVDRWASQIAKAPDELTSSVALVNEFHTPGPPIALRGRPLVAVRACYAGRPSDGMSWFRSWRDWHTPVHDDAGIVPFDATASLTIDPPWPNRAVMTAEWLTHVGPSLVDALRHLTFTVPFGQATEIMHVGGAAARSTTGCFPSRRDTLLLRAVTTISDAGLAGTETLPAVAAQLARLRSVLGGASTGRAQLDLCTPAERDIRVTTTFDDDAMDRLRRVRSMLDPDRVLDRGLLSRTG